MIVLSNLLFFIITMGLSAYYCYLCQENLKNAENRIRNQRYHLERERMIRDSLPQWLWDAYCNCVSDIEVLVLEKYGTKVWDFYDYSPNPRIVYSKEIKIVVEVKNGKKRNFVQDLIDYDIENRKVLGFHLSEEEKRKLEENQNKSQNSQSNKPTDLAQDWIDSNYDEIFQLTKGFNKNALIPWDILPDKDDKELLNDIGCKLVINYGLSAARISKQGLRISVL